MKRFFPILIMFFCSVNILAVQNTKDPDKFSLKYSLKANAVFTVEYKHRSEEIMTFTVNEQINEYSSSYKYKMTVLERKNNGFLIELSVLEKVRQIKTRSGLRNMYYSGLIGKTAVFFLSETGHISSFNSSEALPPFGKNGSAEKTLKSLKKEVQKLFPILAGHEIAISESWDSSAEYVNILDKDRKSISSVKHTFKLMKASEDDKIEIEITGNEDYDTVPRENGTVNVSKKYKTRGSGTIVFSAQKGMMKSFKYKSQSEGKINIAALGEFDLTMESSKEIRVKFQ